MNKVLPTMSASGVRMAWMRGGVYGCFFISGSTALIFEVLWSRQFVSLFGNSSFAVSVVLCAYMTGLGLGGLIGGRVADRIVQRTAAYGAVQAAVAGWAVAMPVLSGWVRMWVPTLPVLSPESLLVSTIARFALSFALLGVPCFLIGMTLPLLARAVIESDRFIGSRVGALYCWNTLGAAVGCVAAGFWMLDTLGMRRTNLLAVGVNVLVAGAALALSRRTLAETDLRTDRSGGASLRKSDLKAKQGSATPGAMHGTERVCATPAALLLCLAFVNGLVGLVCEVVWFRYLAFLEQAAYVFPTVLGIYLAGLGLGGLLYSWLAGRIQLAFAAKALGIVQVLLAISVLATFVLSGLLFSVGPPSPLGLKGMAWLTVFLPTVLMGVAFPLLCSVYGREVKGLGGRVGLLLAVNTLGAVVGSLLPIFVLVPLLGIQRSLLLASLLSGAMGLAVLTWGAGPTRRSLAGSTVAYGVVVILFLTVVPPNVCQRVFLASSYSLARHTEILSYREGRTGTAIVTCDRTNRCKTLYINGNSEVPALYAHELCFKMLGDLGPMLHSHPDEVLMICFGGGIAAGATARLPEVKSLTIVDIESSVIQAAGLLAEQNHRVLEDPKAHIVIDDGRNYILTARRRWPVIISDSTHPKTSDSWVLYTQEFYRLVREHLTGDGVFVEWVPKHGLHVPEFKMILRTFQSVFPHASFWVTQGTDDQGQFASYGLLVGTPQALKIDLNQLRVRLSAEPVRQDLEPYGLETPAGFLDAFICAEDTLRRWVGDGPVNTDDLPYTHYHTRYSTGKLVEPPDFIEPMEDIWPWLAGTASEDSARQLYDELKLRAKARRLALLGRFGEAYSLLPEDGRYRRMRRLYEEGPRYAENLLKLYWDNPNALIYLLDLGSVGPGGVKSIKSVFERVLELDPGNVCALNFMATTYAQAGDLKQAETCLRNALRHEARYVDAHYNLGILLERTGRQGEAFEQWREAATIGGDARAADQWGTCLLRQGHVDEALQWFRRAVEIQPAHVPARLHLAGLLHRMGRTGEARDQARYLLKLDPENKGFLNVLARLGDPNPACPPP